MSLPALASLVLALAGIVLLSAGIRRLRARQLLSAINLGSSGSVLLLLAAIVFLLATNLAMYERLTYEEPVAEIEFTQIGAKHFSAVLDNLPEAQARHFEMYGDEWQLDAQMLLWHGYATVLGLDAQYRLYRLSGRYAEIGDEQLQPRSVHALVDTPRLDLWQLASRYRSVLGSLIDAAYGSAVYLPMTDGARYQVSISRTGLLARPVNDAAKQAVSRWIGL